MTSEGCWLEQAGRLSPQGSLITILRPSTMFFWCACDHPWQLNCTLAAGHEPPHVLKKNKLNVPQPGRAPSSGVQSRGRAFARKQPKSGLRRRADVVLTGLGQECSGQSVAARPASGSVRPARRPDLWLHGVEPETRRTRIQQIFFQNPFRRAKSRPSRPWMHVRRGAGAPADPNIDHLELCRLAGHVSATTC